MSRLLPLLALVCASACHGESPAGDISPNETGSQNGLAPAAKDHADDTEACRRRIAALSGRKRLLGAPALERVRGQVLGRAKAMPVLFLSEPTWTRTDSVLVRGLRERLRQDPSARTLGGLYHHLRGKPKVAREVLLREGYLYTDQPGLAFALAQKVELQHLFDADEIIVERGAMRHLAVREGKYYRWVDGPQAGQRARVLLFDRVWEKGSPLGEPLHVDVEQLANRLGFWKLAVEQLTQDAIVARLAYGSAWVTSLLAVQGANLSLSCEIVPDESKQEVDRGRNLARSRRAILEVEQRAIREMLGEALPFDEPRTEDGQQDGKLRPLWRGAYLRGEYRYQFNEDWYPIFDQEGRPRVPQVCIDFITDTLERASGTWWGRRDEPRARIQGGLSFDEFSIDNKRSVERFVQFAWRHPEWFDVSYTEPEERFNLNSGDDLFDHLTRHAARYRPGDIVNILGLRDDEKYHYHSFFVYKSDPVTGMPLWLAGNAGRPRIQSWQGVLLSAPRRSIHSRIRPRASWLSAVMPPDVTLAKEPGGAGQGSG